ncbi:hypothetical protein KSC_012170 [Ktedonobacter sp. SOSP1-52]|uniref:hypothetical protein n=1 Tax=Ktedonobacter sp. SOSP1-52 TaxID=2778366 RepID=UPI001915FF29|nr:hypothetical protein [Ktedonobacter sp. SOSP1-52]GHO62325.1 hypothetical protein KSC_012170 [Ktedonobacter sp. SOSP1-52]
MMQDDDQIADVHTPDNPYCDDSWCWCHSDADYHEGVVHPTSTKEDEERAFSFFGIFRIGA